MSISVDNRLKVFFDGGCPLCSREIKFLRRLDQHGRIDYIDIAAPEFRPDEFGKTLDELMAEMHVQQPGGQWATGVEAFRNIYSAVGMRRLSWMMGLPLISSLLTLGYRIFARFRLRLAHKCSDKDGICTRPNSPQRTLV